MAGRCKCAQNCNCCTDTSESIAVSGSGSAGQCFTPEVRYSADAGNRARAGTDGAVFADTCLYGPDGEPLTPDPQGCIQVPAPCILDQGGDPIDPNEDGCVQLPANTPPAYGCGLDQDGEGTLIIATGAWPPNDLLGAALAGDQDDGPNLFCATDGTARSIPDHTALLDSASGELANFLPDFETVPDGTSYISPTSAALAVTNPSPSRRLRLIVRAVGLLDAASAPLGDVYGRCQVRQDGGSWNTVRELRWPDNRLVGAPVIRDEKALAGWVLVTLAAGASATFELRVVCANTTDGEGDAATVQRVRYSMVALGVTV